MKTLLKPRFIQAARRVPLPAWFILLGIAAVPALFTATTPAAVHATPVPSLASVPVAIREDASGTAYEGVVEAVRQTVVSAQVPGAVVALTVRAGDRVRAGQVLVQLDAR